MRYGGPELLFYKHGMHEVMEAHRQRAAAAPAGIQDNVLLNTPTDDLVERIVAEWSLHVPVLDRDNAEAESSEGPIEVFDHFRRDYGGGRGTATVQGTIVELAVPFTGDKDFFFIQPTTFDSAPPRALIDKDHVVIRHSSRELNAEQARTGLNSVLDDIERYLGWQRGAAEPFNASLASMVRQAVEARKAKVFKDRNSVADLGFKLKQRPDAPKTYVAPVVRKPIAQPKPTKASEPFKPEPKLEDDTYQQILTIMEGMAHVMERSPSAFVDMGEENLRQHFLVQLNGQFEGAATGETFNFEGKTDILIRVNGKNIFIAECKFWTGPNGFIETIDQLLGYLSWRDTKAAIVMFNRNKDFSKVIAAMVEAATTHPARKRGPEKHGETRFKYVFANPTDANREVTITVMAFDVPKPA
jgi:hypothetical protein